MSGLLENVEGGNEVNRAGIVDEPGRARLTDERSGENTKDLHAARSRAKITMP